MKRIQYFKIVPDPNKKNVRYGFLEMFNEPNIAKKQIVYTVCVLRNSGGAWEQDSVSSTPLAYLTEESLVELLKKNGFRNVKVYGSQYFDEPFKNAYDKDLHDWINVVATR